MRSLLFAALAALNLIISSAFAAGLQVQETVIEQPSNWSARAGLGVRRGSYVEEGAGDETKTEGAYAFPQASFGFDYWRGREGEAAWKYGFNGAVAHVEKLNDVNFPVSWSGAFTVSRKNLLLVGARTRLGAGVMVGGESFSQSTPDRSIGAGEGALTTRTTTVGKAGPSFTIASEAFEQPFDVGIGVNYIFAGTTRVSGAPKSDSLHGIGADVRFVFWFTKHVFTNVLVSGSRLTGLGPRLTGTSASADIGWQF